MKRTSSIAPALLDWHAHSGRHDLPWQQQRTAYRVWVSEIMLQQTQVTTVIGYYQRFMARFSDVVALADAPLDAVLHLWSGLGYYARARNLHRAAQRVRDEFAGQFPQDFTAVCSLPGIGRSTAGAILAIATGARHAILDGNVKRVLARYFVVEGATSERAVEQRLWQLAEECTPHSDVGRYTQAIMDLGATLCVRSKPVCALCPLTGDCSARRQGRQHLLPTPKKRAARRHKTCAMLIALDGDGAVLLEQRPARGIWGGLWCLPEFDTESAARSYAVLQLRNARVDARPLGSVHHAFTHFALEIVPLMTRCEGLQARVAEPESASQRSLWYNLRQPAQIGLPAPIKQLLTTLASLE